MRLLAERLSSRGYELSHEDYEGTNVSVVYAVRDGERVELGVGVHVCLPDGEETLLLLGPEGERLLLEVGAKADEAPAARW